MANLIENDKIFYTPYEPKVQNRFILQVDGIPSFIMKKVSRPQIECGEVVLDHINIIRKVKGKCKWGDITMTLYDPIVPSGAQAVMEWVRTQHESVTGRDGYADFYKKDFDIFVLGPVGDKIENWKVKGAYIKTAQFGDLDWSTETQVEISLTLAVDYCVLEY
ncbi:Bacteriophage T4, Gp19, tail tube [uncultured Caudovirales phage]|uniref:Bacteriophage T4, Gp19, tail tube n=1 Tax=uncultured Caudovirales phage TaxID=2100421 RepID=A0A6J5MF73_9CAUD|nr:Bacteriophage T4, Gp19, tail tube [uncultured Caudovirales phage]